jgi:hypothetical protein
MLNLQTLVMEWWRGTNAGPLQTLMELLHHRCQTLLIECIACLGKLDHEIRPSVQRTAGVDLGIDHIPAPKACISGSFTPIDDLWAIENATGES